MKRRNAIGMTLSLPWTLSLGSTSNIPHLTPNGPASKFFTPETMKDVSGGFYVFKFADDIFANANLITWTPKAGGGDKLQPVQVPWGFVTDLASIPSIFWSMLPRDGKYAFAAVIHDYLYWIQDRPRKLADEIFDKAMYDLEVNDGVRLAITLAVKNFGQSAWETNARLRSGGEKRLLKKLPDSPLVKWSDWKNGDVF